MAYLVSRRLAVPSEDRLVDQGAGGLGDAQRRRHEVSQWFGPVGQTEQPIGGDTKREGAFRDQLPIREAGGRIRQKLRDGRPVDAGRAGKGALVHRTFGHGLRKAVAEQDRTVAFVD